MELFSAIVTLEKLQIQVSALMVLLVSIGDEGLPAEPAHIRLFASVSLDMVRKRGAMPKDLHAGAVGALVLLHPCGHHLIFEGFLMVV